MQNLQRPQPSECITGAAYDHGTLTIRFPGGRVYVYEDVPAWKYARLYDCRISAGRWYNRHVKGQHKSRRVE